MKEQEMFEFECVELGIIPVGSVISDTPMMRAVQQTCFFQKQIG